VTNGLATSADPFAGRLLRGENVIWRGRPRQGLMLNRSDAYLIPFSLLWGGFAIFWEANALRTPNAAPFTDVFGAVFALVGLFMIFGRFFFDAWIRARISYALTDRRILIFRSRPAVSFQSVSLDRLSEATLEETSAGHGTIRFGPAVSIWSHRTAGGLGPWIRSLDPTPQFLGIENVKLVFALVQERVQARSS
jgi:hypothetical protein